MILMGIFSDDNDRAIHCRTREIQGGETRDKVLRSKYVMDGKAKTA